MSLPPLTIVICATPRTGSTLLCALLEASGVAGRPESWFRAEDRADYARDWGIAPADDSAPDAGTYRAAAIRAGQSANGIFGLRIQAATLPSLMAEIGAAPGSARARFGEVFGPCRFLHIRRQDEVAQAVSRLKAEVSQIWHLDGHQPDRPAGYPEYDAARIDAFIAEAAAGNRLWEEWFGREHVTPLRLDYESFSADPQTHVRRILRGLDLPDDMPLEVANRRMADATSRDWAARYRRARGLPQPPC